MKQKMTSLILAFVLLVMPMAQMSFAADGEYVNEDFTNEIIYGPHQITYKFKFLRDPDHFDLEYKIYSDSETLYQMDETSFDLGVDCPFYDESTDSYLITFDKGIYDLYQEGANHFTLGMDLVNEDGHKYSGYSDDNDSYFENTDSDFTYGMYLDTTGTQSYEIGYFTQKCQIASVSLPDELEGAYFVDANNEKIQMDKIYDFNGSGIKLANIPADLSQSTYPISFTLVDDLEDGYRPTIRHYNINLHSEQYDFPLPPGYIPPESTTPSTTVITPSKPAETPADILVGGKKLDIGYNSNFSNNTGQSVGKMTLDTDKLLTQFDKEDTSEITLPFTGNKDNYQGQLDLDLMDQLAQKDGVLSLQTEKSDYILPMAAINMDAMMKDIPDYAKKEDVSVYVNVHVPKKDMQDQIDKNFNVPGQTKDADSSASKDKKDLLVAPVSYDLYSVYNGKANTIDHFNQFVSRLIPLKDDVNSNQITTAIVIKEDGSYYSVPSKVIEKDGKKYLEIKSLTNSTYSAVENKVSVKDMNGHWAKEATESLASKMILDLPSNGAFHPNDLTTTKDFSQTLLKAMGLDVSENWEETFSQIALGNQDLLNQQSISRQEAMSLMANALANTSDYTALTDAQVTAILGDFSDQSSVSPEYQQAVATCIEYGLVSGDSNQHLSPQGLVSNAQMAVMIDQLLAQLQ